MSRCEKGRTSNWCGIGGPWLGASGSLCCFFDFLEPRVLGAGRCTRVAWAKKLIHGPAATTRTPSSPKSCFTPAADSSSTKTRSTCTSSFAAISFARPASALRISFFFSFAFSFPGFFIRSWPAPSPPPALPLTSTRSSRDSSSSSFVLSVAFASLLGASECLYSAKSLRATLLE